MRYVPPRREGLEQGTTESIAQPKTESDKQLVMQHVMQQMLLHILLSLLHIEQIAPEPIGQPTTHPATKTDEHCNQEPLENTRCESTPTLPAAHCG